MGNANCNSNCLSMRPGMECFQTVSPQIKIHGGSAQEIYYEWEEIQSVVASAFQEDPESNFYILKLSRPTLQQLFKKQPQQREQVRPSTTRNY